jgi:hypothetical protein
MNALAGVGILWNSIQAWLLAMLEDELGELDDTHREFVAVCQTCAPQTHMDTCRWVGNGWPPELRSAGHRRRATAQTAVLMRHRTGLGRFD